MLLAVTILALSGCSTKAWYEGMRTGAANQCRALPPGETERCLAGLNPMSYETYTQRRAARDP